MALAARKLVTDPDAWPRGWHSVEQAAECLRLRPRRVQQRCEWCWHQADLARKIRGKWAISPHADPRLSDTPIDTDDNRYLRQLGEMRVEGFGERHILQAIKRREIVLGFYAFKGHTRAEGRLRTEFVNKLRAEGVFPSEDIPKLSKATLRRWCDLYRKPGDEGGVRSLARQPREKQPFKSIGDEAWTFFMEVVHTGTGIKVSTAHEQTVGYIIEQRLSQSPGWAWPSLRTVQKAYQARVPDALRIYVNKGPRACEAQCIPKIRRSYADVAAGDMLVGDERIFDFMVRVAGDRGPRSIRPKLTAWLDARSRMFVGWHIGPRANSDTILSSFKAACLEMGTIVRGVTIDNGKDYRAVGGESRRNRKWDAFDGNRIESVFASLGIETTYAQPHHPWAKMIESHFRTVKDGFDRFMPGFVGGSSEERPWDADRWTKANLHLLPTLEDVRQQFTEWLKAHHAKPQRGDGMNGLSPAQAMQQYFTKQPRRVSDDSLGLLCCRLVGPIKVTRDGVRHNGIQYGRRDERVFRLQGQDVWIAIDPVMGDRVTLCREDGTPICVAKADRIEGVTQEDLRDSIAHGKRCLKVVKKDAPPARRFLLQTPAQRVMTRKRLAAQASQIPDRQLPAPPTPETIHIVRPDIEAGVEKLKKAKGSAAVARPAELNAGAKAANAQHRGSVDWAQFANDEVEPPTPRRLARIDFARFANDDEETENESERAADTG